MLFTTSASLAICTHHSSRFFFVMIRPPPRSTRTDTLFPYTTLFRSVGDGDIDHLRASTVPRDPDPRLIDDASTDKLHDRVFIARHSVEPHQLAHGLRDDRLRFVPPCEAGGPHLGHLPRAPLVDEQTPIPPPRT